MPNAVYPEGDLVRLKIYFSGSTPFEHRLTLNGAEVSADSQSIRLVDFDDHILITIPELHAQSTGRFEYTVRNDSGEATAGFWLNVSGLPAAPEGPLEVSNVSAHQATITWRPPADDGGQRIQNYVLEKHDIDRPADEWTLVASAVRELSFIASGLFAGHSYIFRIAAANANGIGVPLMSTEPTLAQLPFGAPSEPQNLAVVDVGAEFAVLSWQRPRNDHNVRLRGYYVEKKESATGKRRPRRRPTLLTRVAFQISGKNAPRRRRRAPRSTSPTSLKVANTTSGCTPSTTRA